MENTQPTPQQKFLQKIEGQFNYHDREAAKLNKFNKRLVTASLIIGALIPLMAVVLNGTPLLGPVTGLLGATATFLTGLIAFRKDKDLAVEYRQVAENLRLLQIEFDAGQMTFEIFMKRALAILKKHRQTFEIIHQDDDDGRPKKKD